MLKFRIDTDRLTFGDLLSLEGGKLPDMVNVMARSMVNDADEFMGEDEAHKAILSIPLSKLKEVVEQFGAALNEYKEGAIPPTGGGK